jgi:hypothetical protein
MKKKGESDFCLPGHSAAQSSELEVSPDHPDGADVPTRLGGGWVGVGQKRVEGTVRPGRGEGCGRWTSQVSLTFLAGALSSGRGGGIGGLNGRRVEGRLGIGSRRGRNIKRFQQQ